MRFARLGRRAEGDRGRPTTRRKRPRRRSRGTADVSFALGAGSAPAEVHAECAAKAAVDDRSTRSSAVLSSSGTVERAQELDHGTALARAESPDQERDPRDAASLLLFEALRLDRLGPRDPQRSGWVHQGRDGYLECLAKRRCEHTPVRDSRERSLGGVSAKRSLGFLTRVSPFVRSGPARSISAVRLLVRVTDRTSRWGLPSSPRTWRCAGAFGMPRTTHI